MIPCESQMLCAYQYFPAEKVLAVQFKAGGPVYRYTGVDKEKADAFVAAPSKGKFFLSEVKGKHEFEKVEPVKGSDDDGA